MTKRDRIQRKTALPSAPITNEHTLGAEEVNKLAGAAFGAQWPASYSHGYAGAYAGIPPSRLEEFEISSLTIDTGDTEDSGLYLGKPRSYDHSNAQWVNEEGAESRGPLRIDASDIDVLLEVGDRVHCWWDWQREFWIPFLAISTKSVNGACNSLIEAQATGVAIELEEGPSSHTSVGTHIVYHLEKDGEVLNDKKYHLNLITDGLTSGTGFVTFRAGDGDQITLSACLASGSDLDAEIVAGSIRLETKCKVGSKTDQTGGNGTRDGTCKFVKGFNEVAKINNGDGTGQPKYTVRNSLIEIATPDTDEWLIEAEFSVTVQSGLLSSSSSVSSQSSASSSQSSSSQSSASSALSDQSSSSASSQSNQSSQSSSSISASSSSISSSSSQSVSEFSSQSSSSSSFII